LDEALSFLLQNASPDSDCWDDCSAIAVAIGNDEWGRQIRARLTDSSWLDQME